MEHGHAMAAIAALRDQTAHVVDRLHRRIIGGLDIGGAKIARATAGPRPLRQRRAGECDDAQASYHRSDSHSHFFCFPNGVAS